LAEFNNCVDIGFYGGAAAKCRFDSSPILKKLLIIPAVCSEGELSAGQRSEGASLYLTTKFKFSDNFKSQKAKPSWTWLKMELP